MSRPHLGAAAGSYEAVGLAQLYLALAHPDDAERLLDWVVVLVGSKATTTSGRSIDATCEALRPRLE